MMTYNRYSFLTCVARGDVPGVTMIDRLAAIDELNVENPQTAQRLRRMIEREPGLCESKPLEA